jgi:hypothetical protein
MLISRKVPARPASPSSSRTPAALDRDGADKMRPRPTGQFTGVVSSASVFSIVRRSNGSRLSRSILLIRMTIGMSQPADLEQLAGARLDAPSPRRSP